MINVKSKPLKVSEVNQYIKRVFAGDWLLSNMRVEGEISNFKHHYSGHMYFSLKDDRGKIKCVMFKNDNKYIDFDIKDGIKVVCTGYISIYEKEGDYQLYVKDIEENGIGNLFVAFEELKRKLEKEGLFDESSKKKLPFFPKKIGIVTSSTGAAIKDIITVIKRRFPVANIIIYPVLVQGEQAPEEICKGLKFLDEREDIDVIITGRGGGSIEELFAFNDEAVARTIFAMNTPVVSAVGHETDFTIADFVADLRAPTPSAAAEIVTPELDKLMEDLNNKCSKLCSNINYLLSNNSVKLSYIKRSLDFNNPVYQLREKVQELDNLFKRLNIIMEKRIEFSKGKLTNLFNNLNFLNPITSLNRGYSIILDKNENMITTIEGISKNDELKLLLKDGIINVKVINISKGEHYYDK
ncbi:exodeoxyribonuclease 7 large subunit [Tepidimicrobium xylanilyticum]|uniref:Exodeoxyribonuclease 7 large subunit n=1 Tax=Tepidimicrobium xylanilyticum TaxID=1123352 RepID=A0A1H3CRY9_9FIRM|nr:exodeoxyribonuclease 7 large subunit [Tepidimicrobium xylanilyticum]SDX56895.1 Exodeoxyribonuclease VII large subunit [Tepidimicrobium xylanilyticum]